MMYEIAVQQAGKMLHNLLLILNESARYAEEKGFAFEVLLQARLAPDQFALVRQVQIACDGAKMAAARLAGKEKDAPSFPDTEETLPQIAARIESTMAYLEGFSPDDFSAAAERRISQPRWKGKSLSGTEYLIQHATPNLYFHVTTTYAILRHNGVPVGKKNYLGALPSQE